MQIIEFFYFRRQPSLREDDGGSSLIELHHQAISSIAENGTPSTISTHESSNGSVKTACGTAVSSGQQLSVLHGNKLAEPNGQPRSASYTGNRPASPDGPEVRSRSYDHQRDEVLSSEKGIAFNFPVNMFHFQPTLLLFSFIFLRAK